MDYTIWARVTHSGPQEFVAMASAVALGAAAPDRAHVLMEVCASRALAEIARDRLAIALGSTLRERGDQVVDVEVE